MCNTNNDSDEAKITVWRIPVDFDLSAIFNIKRYFGFTKPQDVLLNNNKIAIELFKENPEKYRELSARANS